MEKRKYLIKNAKPIKIDAALKDAELNDGILLEMPFYEDWRDRILINNELIVDEEKIRMLEKEKLRERRKAECFEYWNRQWVIEPEPNKPHQVTQEQFNEMELWYEAWLNVTETMIIPTKPEWLAI